MLSQPSLLLAPNSPQTFVFFVSHRKTYAKLLPQYRHGASSDTCLVEVDRDFAQLLPTVQRAALVSFRKGRDFSG